MNFVGKYCVIRAKDAGVFAGTVMEHNGQEVLLKDARRLWYWDGACSISQIAVDGVKNPQNCQFAMPVDELGVFGVIEIIPATKKAREIIEEVKIWKK